MDDQLRLWQAEGWMSDDEAAALHALVAHREAASPHGSAAGVSSEPVKREMNDDLAVDFLIFAFVVPVASLFAAPLADVVWRNNSPWAQYTLLVLCLAFFAALARSSVLVSRRRVRISCGLLALAVSATLAGVIAYDYGWSQSTIRWSVAGASSLMLAGHILLRLRRRVGNARTWRIPVRLEREVFGALVLAVALLVAFAREDPPHFASLPDQLNPSVNGQMALLSYRHHERCIEIAPVGGGVTVPIRCAGESGAFIDDFEWTDDGMLAVFVNYTVEPKDVTHIYDPSTGRLIRTDPQHQSLHRPEGRLAFDNLARRDDGALLELHNQRRGDVEVTLQQNLDRRTVFHARGPGDYTLDGVGWSSSGRWAIVSDSAGRILAIDTENPGDAFVLAADVADFAWRE